MNNLIFNHGIVPLKYDFILIGYSIRRKEAVRGTFHKPGCKIITADFDLQPLHDLHGSLGTEYFEGFYNPWSAFRYDYKTIDNMFTQLKDKSEYAIFGYAIHKDDILKYFKRSFANVNDNQDHDVIYFRYSYAMIDQKEPIGALLGYDVIDIDIGNCSLLNNMSLDWREAQKCGMLNANHLYFDYESALCLKNKGCVIEPVHAPYAVWAIYECI